MAAQRRINVNFPEVFIDRLDEYARKRGMKRNAVLKKAFELLEDQESLRVASPEEPW